MLPAIALIGEVKGSLQVLKIESDLLPQRCGSEVVVHYGRWCAGHRECRGDKHANNCLLSYFGDNSDHVAGRTTCSARWIGEQKVRLSQCTRKIAEVAEEDKFLDGISKVPHTKINTVYQLVATTVEAHSKTLVEISQALARRCNEPHEFQRFESVLREHKRPHGRMSHCNRDAETTVLCDNSFRESSKRVDAARVHILSISDRLRKLAAEHEKLTKIRNASVRKLQAYYRGHIARMTLAIQQEAVTKVQAVVRGYLTRTEMKELHGPAAAVGAKNDARPKRRTRRSGMWRRQQRSAGYAVDGDAVEALSIPDTEDSFR